MEVSAGVLEIRKPRNCMRWLPIVSAAYSIVQVTLLSPFTGDPEALARPHGYHLSKSMSLPTELLDKQWLLLLGGMFISRESRNSLQTSSP